MEGYHEKREDGKYSGMDVEYLEALSRYAGWKIEYVECGSWDEALELVAQHKADLVGSAQYSAQRAEQYQYADLSSGYTFGVIAARSDSDLAYEDFTAMGEITFGMVETYVRRDDFFQYLDDHGVSAPRVRTYQSSRQLRAALERGEIDAMVHTFMEIEEGPCLRARASTTA